MVAFLAIFFLPHVAAAYVIISEIMYDAPGTEGSGDHDWIEVFNAGGTAVDLSTYRFFESGTNHTLKLNRGSDNLPSGAYAVIANATSTFVMDWPSFSGTLFDSSFNLTGSGETLAIKNADLVDTDSITYVPVESASNNGNSLHRATVAGTSFIAGKPTPGSGSLTADARNTGSQQTANQTQGNQAQTTSGAISGAVSSYVAPPTSELFADAGLDRAVIVGADVEYRARAYNQKKEIVENVRFLWNFGDASTAEGQAVMHHFDYPGRYAIILHIAENRNAASDQIIVTAEPAKLSFSVLPDGGVVIENRSGRDLDLSRWIVRGLTRTFILPENSIILAGSSLRISQKTLGLAAGVETELQYPNGVLVLHAGQESGETNTPPVGVVNTTRKNAENSSTSSAASEASEPIAKKSEPPGRKKMAAETREAEPDVLKKKETVAEGVVTTSTTSEQVAATGTLFDPSHLWWFGAAGIALVGAAGVFLIRRKKSGGTFDAWTIIDEGDATR